MQNYKKCTKCGELKPMIEFHKKKKFKDGFHIYCRLCIKKLSKIDYLKNKEKRLLQQKEYRKNPKVKKIRQQYKKDYLQKNPNYRISHSLRTRIGQAVRGYRKAASTWKLIDCSPEELCKHLSNKFKEGMTWDNYGQWHIDHIIPCSSFDLSKPEEQFKCCHWTNLQPLWANENCQKSNKILHL